ncbi:MAG: membrane dipeptidase [Bacteroidetes bacterium]|nr:MAG: membrane dipeptidase [Bacteroidota bacterium]
MKIRLLTALAVAFSAIACGTGETAEPSDRAREIARTSIIIDTHIDVPYRLSEKWADVADATEDGNFDYPRAVAGGLNAPFMSIYTPSVLEAEGRSRIVAEELIDMVEGIVSAAPDKFAIALSTDDVRRHFDEGLISFPLGMENGSPIEGDIANLEYFYDRGIRYITLAHNLSNHISDSSRDDPQWDGLSLFGIEMVIEMNRLGIMVDVSHISDDAFWDTMEISHVPAIASHSTTRHFTPGWPRNMSDEMIVALADHGGAIMINFGSSFLSKEANTYRYGRRDAYRLHLSENQIEGSDEEEEAFNKTWEEDHGLFPFADLETVLDHYDHIIALVGIDHVGIGSDYDGVGDTLPVGLKDVSTYPNLIEGFIRRGYSDEDIRKILGENLLRVWGEAEAFAKADA